MKKIITLSLMAVLLSGLAYGQLANRYLLGGSFSYDHAKQEQGSIAVKETALAAGSSFGVMLNQSVAIGVNMGVSHQMEEQEGGSWYGSEKDELTQIYLGLFLRTHHRITDNFMVYAEPYIHTILITNDDIEEKPTQNGGGVNVGLLYFVKPSFSIELNLAGLHYLHIRDEEFDIDYNQFNIEYDIATPNIGLKYYF